MIAIAGIILAFVLVAFGVLAESKWPRFQGTWIYGLAAVVFFLAVVSTLFQ